MDELEKKDLSEAIEEGVSNAIWKPFYYLCKVIIILFFAMAIWSLYSQYKQNECVKSGECYPIIYNDAVAPPTTATHVIIDNPIIIKCDYFIDEMNSTIKPADNNPKECRDP